MREVSQNLECDQQILLIQFSMFPKNPQGPSNGGVFMNLYDAGVFLGPQNSRWIEGVFGFLGFSISEVQLLVESVYEFWDMASIEDCIPEPSMPI